MRRAVVAAAVMLLLVPVVAEAATLTVPRAQQLARAEAQQRADQEQNGRSVEVGDCSRRSVRYVTCRVGWQYTEEFDGRQTVDCSQRDSICSEQEERIWKSQQRTCTASVVVRYISRRDRKGVAVLSGQRCTPFFENSTP